MTCSPSPTTIDRELAPFWSQRVINRACEMYGIDRATLLGPSRFKKHIRPRFAAAYTMRYMGMDYADVGRRLGGRDHSTIMNACEKVQIYCRYEPGLADVIAELVDAASPGASDTLDLPGLTQ